MSSYLRKYTLKIFLFFCSLTVIFQSCCPGDGCDEFCTGFQLRLSFAQDSTQAEFFPKNVMDSMFVIRTIPGRANDTQRIGSGVIFTFSTPQDPAGFQFNFFSTDDSTLNLQLDSIQSIIQPEECCKCGELSATEFNFSGQRQRVPRGGTFVVTP